LPEKINCPKCNLNLNTNTELEKHIKESKKKDANVPILNIDSKDWEKKILKSKMLILVEFWHQNCPACKDFAPILNKVANNYKDKLNFFRLNVLQNQENRELAVKYGLTSTPTLIFFCNGKPIATKEDREGFETEDQFEELINNMINSCS
jgi:thioredoxin 1